MATVNIVDDGSQLPRLVSVLESGSESEVILARDGRPTARIIALNGIRIAPGKDVSRRIGTAKGKYKVPADIDELNPEIEKLFYGEQD